MSFPNVIYGDYGDEKVAQSTEIGNLPFGQLMVLPDGSKFRHAQAGSAVALSAGVLVSCSAGLADHGAVAASGLIASSVATYNTVKATAVHVTSASVAVTKDYYAGGLLNVQDDTGEGHVYRIKSNKSAAVSSDVEITLEPTDRLITAFNPGVTTVGLRRNPYKEMILHNQGTIIAPPMGATPVAVSASFYFWCQRSGPVSLRTGATTVVDGAPVHAASATAGSVTVPPTTADTTTVVAAYNLQIRNTPIGHALETVTATEQVLVNLGLE